MRSRSCQRVVVAAMAAVAAIVVAILVIAATGASGATAAPNPTPVRVEPSAENIAAGHGCRVTGDLVFSPEGTNQGNPAEVAQRLCQQNP
ncbi:MAG: hypothetical protein JOZ65_24595 [Chloroflexi bacterium]|nr:hypothetical protein [Chloroflexota bacterium]